MRCGYLHRTFGPDVLDASGPQNLRGHATGRRRFTAGQQLESTTLQVQYRDRLEFAIGRTCSVDWTVAEGARRASEVWTTWLPTCQTPQTTAEEIGEALLDMTVLATASPAQLRAGLPPIITGYRSWLGGRQRQADALPEHLRDEGRDAVSDARKVAGQLADGLEHLLSDDEALRCFRFMNQVMADQRIQSQVAQLRAATPSGVSTRPVTPCSPRARRRTRGAPSSWPSS